MSDKYIIKNCPNCLTYNRPKAICGLTYETGGFKGETTNYKYCQDCTDCLLKRIVKITKNYNKGCGKHCDINRKENNCGKTCNAYKIRQILELLDIQECE